VAAFGQVLDRAVAPAQPVETLPAGAGEEPAAGRATA
jgi:hypothetical protein